MTAFVHEHYKTLDIQTLMAVDEAFIGIAEHLKDCGISTSMDDRAEKLVDAIAAYVLECRNDPAQ